MGVLAAGQSWLSGHGGCGPGSSEAQAWVGQLAGAEAERRVRGLAGRWLHRAAASLEAGPEAACCLGGLS